MITGTNLQYIVADLISLALFIYVLYYFITVTVCPVVLAWKYSYQVHILLLTWAPDANTA